ncbi:CheR family methyltransferase [Nocardioides dongkuii]|uniref:CheR family methyltransferase n=1 Tax=Nocardioides dongkuii TaxID=2760089 RepID=UPI0015FCF534|nr:CheR family methyltransferase [Nocardioides dongkuii]
MSDGLEAVLVHIKEQRGFDFTGYKRASLARRVQRRMDAVGIESHDAYLDHLTVHPDEFTELFNTILINVTAFFRDPDAWQYLQEELLPPILQRRDGQPFRVWVAGCASGEEAYTMAMVLAELLGLEGFRQRVKIYATDVDEEALAQARLATYAERDLRAVPPELRERYFESSGTRFVLRKELRRSVIFGRNDLVQDAPISHVDVLTCRNTLMYLNAETQAHILGRMHFALRPDGVLFLGKAEMLLSQPTYFQPVELRRRFFSKVATDGRDRRLGGNRQGPDTAGEHERGLTRLREAALMSSAAAQVVLDHEGRLALANNRAMHLFGLSLRDLGRLVQDLELSYRPVELRGHLDDAVAARRTTWVREVEMLRGGDDAVVLDVQLVPLFNEAGRALGSTVLFHDVTQTRQLQIELLQANHQLEAAYEELQSTNEELETTNEELQSTVEELETTNEELQSTNEELETMNEELQSMNDELHLINETLRERQGEIDRLNVFMMSVLGSMTSGVVVVDADLRILAWNSRSEELWGVRTDEALGQHLMTLDIGLPLEQLREPIRSQLAARRDPAPVLVDAVDRRGRPLRVRTTVTHITDDGHDGPAAMVVMEVLGEGPPGVT